MRIKPLLPAVFLAVGSSRLLAGQAPAGPTGNEGSGARQTPQLGRTLVTDEPRFVQIARMEDLLSSALTGANAQELDDMLAPDFESFTDTGGHLTKAELLEKPVGKEEKRALGAPDEMRYRASLMVLPCPDCGALAFGAHTFADRPNLEQKFAHIWSQQGGRWRLLRAIGYGLASGTSDVSTVKAIKEADADMFRHFNARNADGLGTCFSPDAEFYHDQVGRTLGRDAIVASFRRKFDSDTRERKHLRRKLRPETLQVHIIPGFGALEVAEHHFEITDQGRSSPNTVTVGQILHLYRLAGGRLETRIAISYDHNTFAFAEGGR